MGLGLALGTWAGAVACSDWTSRRIPNLWLLAMLAPALAVLAVTGAGLLGAGWVASLTGFALAGGLLLPGYAGGWLGAGDVKFAACLGFLLGGVLALEMLLVAAMLLGAASAMLIAYAGSQRARRVPAGPAFAAAFLVELVAGPWLIT